MSLLLLKVHSNTLSIPALLLVIYFLLFFGIILYQVYLKMRPKIDIEKYYKNYKKVFQTKMFSKGASAADESFASVRSDSGGLQLNEQYRETILESNFHVFIDDN